MARSNKDKCYGPLQPASEEQASEWFAAGSLDLCDRKLLCTCGAMVGAQRIPKHMYSDEAAYEAHPRFYPYPRPHAKPKPVRQIARKRDGGKRL